ncbi:uncharacterized protein LAJ45_00216 [Morchella importuna]|uniref:uncharacterized protein n=1 Tax=Morchella importuna TaxID=1174673 RepID=UPI001E8EE7DC|nr:uncharacterized protein LAJ45_00216 [Morchella importuna]KAH8155207.1 hypothetical protein LAJ45_00216 [Morchella importuna]
MSHVSAPIDDVLRDYSQIPSSGWALLILLAIRGRTGFHVWQLYCTPYNLLPSNRHHGGRIEKDLMS